MPYGTGTTGGGGGGVNWLGETPTGAVDGINAAFTLAHSPSPAAGLMLSLNGQVLKAGGTDFTLAGAAITMVVAPIVGDILQAFYAY